MWPHRGAVPAASLLVTHAAKESEIVSAPSAAPAHDARVARGSDTRSLPRAAPWLLAGSAVFGARTRLQVQPRRSAVVVEANLFSRVARVFRSYANAIGAHSAPRQSACLHPSMYMNAASGSLVETGMPG